MNMLDKIATVVYRLIIVWSLLCMFCINIFGYISLFYWFIFMLNAFMLIFGKINSDDNIDMIRNISYVKLYGFEILLTSMFPFGFWSTWDMVKKEFGSPNIMLDIIMGDDDYSYNKFKKYVDKHGE